MSRLAALFRPAAALQDHAAPAQEHGSTGASGAQEFDLGRDVLADHILNSPEYHGLFGVHFGFPRWEPFGIDLSIDKHTFLLLVAAVIATVVVVRAARAVAGLGRERAPSGLANAVEAIFVFFRDDVCKSNIGPGYQRFLPFVLALFFFILSMNLLGLVPWGGSATGNLSVTAALAVLTFLVTEVAGLLKLGPRGYMRTIFFVPEGVGGVGKVFVLALMAPIELLGKVTKPLALAIRLFANMTAGHMLIFTVLGLVFVFAEWAGVRWFVAGASFGMVVAFLLMELLIAVIQAYVFAMLSAVFIGMMQHEH